MGGMSFMHILILLVIMLIFFGPGKLPQLGESLGKAIRGFKEGLDEANKALNTPVDQRRHAPPSSPTQASQAPPQQASPALPPSEPATPVESPATFVAAKIETDKNRPS